jgi:hypothetical protein
MKEEINPFTVSFKIDVFVKGVEELKTIATDLDGVNTVTGRIQLNKLIEVDKHVSIYMTSIKRQIYMNLSLPAHKILRYIEGIIRFNEDSFHFNIDKFMEESFIKSRTTVYEGLNELRRYAFIAPTTKRGNYWINPEYFFFGNRKDKYPNNIKIV